MQEEVASCCPQTLATGNDTRAGHPLSRQEREFSRGVDSTATVPCHTAHQSTAAARTLPGVPDKGQTQQSTQMVDLQAVISVTLALDAPANNQHVYTLWPLPVAWPCGQPTQKLNSHPSFPIWEEDLRTSCPPNTPNINDSHTCLHIAGTPIPFGDPDITNSDQDSHFTLKNTQHQALEQVIQENFPSSANLERRPHRGPYGLLIQVQVRGNETCTCQSSNIRNAS